MEEDISVGLVGFGCTSLSARADVWTILGPMHFAIYRPWGACLDGDMVPLVPSAVCAILRGLTMPWWGCVALSCNILQFCKGLTMPWWRSPPPLRWDLGTCGHSTLHPVLCLHHQHHHQHHCQLLPMHVRQIKPGIALNSQTCGESWIATEVKVVLNVHQLYHNHIYIRVFFLLFSLPSLTFICEVLIMCITACKWMCTVQKSAAAQALALRLSSDSYDCWDARGNEAVRQTNLLLLKRNLTADEIVFKSSPVRRSI